MAGQLNNELQPTGQPPQNSEGSVDIMSVVTNALLKNPGKARELLDDLDKIDPSLRPMVIDIAKQKYPNFAGLIDKFVGRPKDDDSDSADLDDDDDKNMDDDDWDDALTYAAKQRRKGMAYGDICERVYWKYRIDWQPLKLKHMLMSLDDSVERSGDDETVLDEKELPPKAQARVSRTAERMKKLAEENKKMKDAVQRNTMYLVCTGCGIVTGIIGFIAGKLI